MTHAHVPHPLPPSLSDTTAPCTRHSNAALYFYRCTYCTLLNRHTIFYPAGTVRHSTSALRLADQTPIICHKPTCRDEIDLIGIRRKAEAHDSAYTSKRRRCWACDVWNQLWTAKACQGCGYGRDSVCVVEWATMDGHRMCVERWVRGQDSGRMWEEENWKKLEELKGVKWVDV